MTRRRQSCSFPRLPGAPPPLTACVVRLNTEFALLKTDGHVAVAGSTVQLLTAAATGEVLLVPPPLYERCRARWKAGEFACLH